MNCSVFFYIPPDDSILMIFNIILSFILWLFFFTLFFINLFSKKQKYYSSFKIVSKTVIIHLFIYFIYINSVEHEVDFDHYLSLKLIIMFAMFILSLYICKRKQKLL